MTTNAMFNDNDLKMAAQLVAESMLNNLPPKSECEHDFSDNFLAKMEKLLHRQKQCQAWHKMVRFAAAVIITVTITFGAVMAASPTARAAVVQWVREIYENSMIYRFFSETTEDTLPLYRLDWIPEGFEETDVFYNDIRYKALYLNDETGQGFVFEYYYMDDSTAPMVIPGDGCVLEQTKINGNPADYYQESDGADTNILMVFDEENNICFSVSATLDKDSIFTIAEHIVLDDSTK